MCIKKRSREANFSLFYLYLSELKRASIVFHIYIFPKGTDSYVTDKTRAVKDHLSMSSVRHRKRAKDLWVTKVDVIKCTHFIHKKGPMALTLAQSCFILTLYAILASLINWFLSHSIADLKPKLLLGRRWGWGRGMGRKSYHHQTEWQQAKINNWHIFTAREEIEKLLKNQTSELKNTGFQRSFRV